MATQVGYDARVPLDPEMMRARVNPYDSSRGAPYQQLMAALREAIASGELAAREELPGEYALGEMVGLHRNTVRSAVNELVNEGLLVKRAGGRTRVVAPPQVRVMSTARYAAALAKIREHAGTHPQSSAFTDDHGVGWSDQTVLAHYEEALATPEEASRLDLIPPTDGTSWWILRRRLVKQIHGETVQLQHSVMPLPLVEGTPVADPARQPWPGGTIAELHSIGQVVTRVREEAKVRPPTPDERRELGMDTAGPVVEIVRVFYVGTRPVEYSVAVLAAMAYTLLFETELR